jgi:hypothetical protein
MTTFRKDLRPDFSPEAWNRSAQEIAAAALKGPLPDGWLMNGQPTADVLAPGEVRVACPQCGTPHIATFSTTDPVHGSEQVVTLTDPRLFSSAAGTKSKTVVIPEAIPGFTCTAGDCGYTGVVGRV